MVQDIAMLNVVKILSLMAKQTQSNGENMVLAVLNLIYGKQINKQVSSQVILVEFLVTTDVKVHNVALMIKDIKVYVTKMDVG